MTTLEYIADKFQLDPNSRRMPIIIPNTNRQDLAKLFGELGFKRGAEIGTEQGAYAETLCKANPGLKLFCIDPWQAHKNYLDHVGQAKLDQFYQTTKERMAPYDCVLVREYSVEAASHFKDGSLDFVYIDANHELLHVIQDISIWRPKVREGGIISGHDYIKRKSRHKMHVIPAVVGYTEAYQIRPWFLLGRKGRRPGERRDMPRSWMWVN